MENYIEKVAAEIEKQQKGKEGTAPFVVGEQLKDICKNNPIAAEIVLQDLKNKSMYIVECEKKIKEYADKHKKGNFSFVSPDTAESIIRKFYGITDKRFTTEKSIEAAVKQPSTKPTSVFDLI